MTASTRQDLERRAADGDHDAALALADALDAEGRHSDAINVLARAARLGGAVAKGRVGARLLIGDRAPAMPPQGAGLIEEAARGGSAEACALLAALTAAGVYRRQSWPDALDWLARAAELGSAHARGQLTVLAGERTLAREAGEAGEAAPADAWRRLRGSVDVAASISPPPARTLCEAPLIRSYAGFAAPEACDWLIARGSQGLRRAVVYGGVAADRNRVDDVRTNSIRGFSLTEVDLVQLMIQARMAAATGIPFRHMESPAVLHYAPGEVFDDHYDFVDPATPGYRQIIARDGERVVTFLVYLNDDYEGGETDFPRLGLSHKGARGEGLFFTNALPEGGPDTRALHAGRPPTRGEKWVVSQFIRSRPFVPGVQAG